MVRRNNLCINPRFFDLELYAIYHVIYDYLKESTWDIVWRVGEVIINEIKDLIDLDKTMDPFEALKKLGEWLKEMGYFEDLEVRRVSENEIEYVMLNPVISSGAKKLIDEGRVPPHISTALMFAVLKRFNMTAEMIGEPIFLPDGRVVERWRLTRLS
ncbi:MAG: hypothetical protein ACP5GI_06605 [Sulfolobales archaeon]